MIAAVLSEKDEIETYFPKNSAWFDLNDNSEVESGDSGRFMTQTVDSDKIKVYQAEGTVIPIFSEHGMSTKETIENNGYIGMIALGDSKTASGNLIIDCDMKSKTPTPENSETYNLKNINFEYNHVQFSHDEIIVDLENAPEHSPVGQKNTLDGFFINGFKAELAPTNDVVSVEAKFYLPDRNFGDEVLTECWFDRELGAIQIKFSDEFLLVKSQVENEGTSDALRVFIDFHGSFGYQCGEKSLSESLIFV